MDLHDYGPVAHLNGERYASPTKSGSNGPPTTEAQATLAAIDLYATPVRGGPFPPTLAANVDNEKLSDADFRLFVRNSLRGLVFPPDRQVVMTNRGEDVPGRKPVVQMARQRGQQDRHQRSGVHHGLALC